MRGRRGVGRGARLALAALLLGLAAASPAAPPATPVPEEGAPRPLGPDELVMMDFQDVELPTLVKFVSEITGRNFLLDDRVRGKVSVISPTKITVSEAYRVFQSVLQVKGFTLVDTGPVVKIVPTKDLKGNALPVEAGVERPSGPGETFVTRIIPLVHLEASGAATLLQPLVARDGLISAYTPTNSLIVVDSAANIDRLLELIADLDVPGQERTVEVIPLRHAFADELASILADALEGEGAKPRAGTATSRVGALAKSTSARRTTVGSATPTLKVVPEIRSNSLVLIGSRYEIRQARSLIDQLDMPLPQGTGRINVVRLRHADASDLVQVIADLLGTSVSLPQRRQLPGRPVSSRERGLGASGLGAGRLTGSGLGLGRGSRSGLGGAGPRRSVSGPTAAARGGSAGTGGSALELEGEVRVTADPATNSLLISADPRDFATLRDVIDQLDVPRRQVLVEAIIFEITLDRARELGIELQGATSMLNGKGIGIARTSFSNLGALSSAVTGGGPEALNSISGLLAAVVSQQNVVLPDGTEVPAAMALLSALESDTDINVLSAPTILTSDNEEAEIIVAQNVPFVTSRATDQTNLANTFSNIDRRDVGITLRITPQITAGGQVRLFVFQEVSALVETSETQVLQLGPTTTVRSASTTVVVGNDETVAIGGLISDRLSSSRSGVPYLSSIPVVGNFFRFDRKRKNKVNLIILLTPHVVETRADLRRASSEQKRLFREARRGRTRFAGTRAAQPRPPPEEPVRRGGVLLPALGPEPSAKPGP